MGKGKGKTMSRCPDQRGEVEREQREAVVNVRGERMTAFGYADDLAAISATLAGMQQIAWVVSVLGAFATLVLAHQKTEYLSVGGSGSSDGAGSMDGDWPFLSSATQCDGIKKQ